MKVVPARRQDLEAVVALLADCRLPTEDVHDHLDDFVVVREGEAVRAVAGLEVHGDCALLRSVAVAASWRGRGIARQLCDFLIARAKSNRVPQVFLLTTGAAEYFGKLGFHPVGRDAVPSQIRATGEFSHLCPQTAAVLMRDLGRAD